MNKTPTRTALGASPTSCRLSIEDLTVTYAVGGSRYPVLRSIRLGAEAGEIVGIVGESGCGKSTLAASLMGLLPPNGQYAAGAIRLEGADLIGLDESEWRDTRGRRIAFIPQDPLSALNPTLRILTQLVDVQRAHGELSKKDARLRAVEMLARVGIPAGARLRSYPHQFSGGMRQRILIAMALLLEPEIIVADEPTSALDATLDAQILELLRDVRNDLGSTILLITHDLGSVAELCDRVVVMYAGEVVEMGSVRQVLGSPKHPYTQGLIAVTPSYLRAGDGLHVIPGRVPDLTAPHEGCSFADRCSFALPRCREGKIKMRGTQDHFARCVLVSDSEAGVGGGVAS